MPKFVLIDHSLRDLGGHHYPYAYNVLAAAERAGWQPVLAVHRGFDQHSALPAGWRVHALYSHESYSRHTLDTQAQLEAPSGIKAGLWQPARRWWARRMREKLAARFARDCATLFALEPLAGGDQVFIATTSELDLAGLATFLAQSGRSADCDWHLQFHFGVFRGREPDYPAQASAAAAVRDSFIRSLSACSEHRLHFYCTTEQLTSQYRRLGVATFSTLPYPVHELFRPRAERTGPETPLRIACLGHSRREKGYVQLPRILRALWDEWFGRGRAQLVLQTRHRRARHALQRLVASLGPGPPGTRGALDFAGFPLPLAAYAELLRSADIGLMLYDPTRYYARCSGVLLEMLCAGVPVLVPAGGWLADQIEAENQRYLDGIAQLSEATPCPEQFTIEVRAGQQALLICCQWRAQAADGEYLRLEFVLEAGSAAHQRRAVVILGPRTPPAPVRTLLRLPPDCLRVHMSMHNAWQQGAPPAIEPSWALLPAAKPMGALGLTVADFAEVPRLLDEVLEHCEHYRARVIAHAPECARAHSGSAVLAGLGVGPAPSIARSSPTT